MAGHHILCLHGMGQHSRDWIHDTDDRGPSLARALKHAWDSYPSLEKMGFDRELQLFPLHYADAMEAHMAPYQKQIHEVTNEIVGNPLLRKRFHWMLKLLARARQVKTGADFFYRHLMDLLLFWASPRLCTMVVEYTAKQIIDYVNQLEENPETRGQEVSILGYCLGTAVADQALKMVFENKGGPGSLVKDYKFKVLAQVSNLSRVLAQDPEEVYGGRDGNLSFSRPSVLPGWGCCWKMINCNHGMDFAALFEPFDPPLSNWLDAETREMEFYRNIRLTDLSGGDPRGLIHYVRDPDFHIPFFELVLSRRIPFEEKVAVKAAFAGRAGANGSSFGNALAEMMESPGRTDWDFYMGLRRFSALIQRELESEGRGAGQTLAGA